MARVLSLLAIVFSFAASPAMAVWQPTDGPSAASVVSLAIDTTNDDVYLATQNALFRSTDGGATWGDIGSAAGITNILSLYKEPGGPVLVGVSLSGVWWSTNGGLSWGQDQITNDPHTGLGASISAVGVAANGAWLAGSFRSANNGGTWSQMTIGGLAFARTVSTTLAGTSVGVYRSANGGASWTPSNTGMVGQRIESLAVDANGDVYAAGYGVGAYRSTDDGQTWTSVSAGLPSMNVRDVDVDGTGRVFVATSNAGVFVSEDSGATWAATAGVLPDVQTTSVRNAPSGDLFVGAAAGGVFTSANGGVSWQTRNAGLHARGLESMLFATSGSALACSFGNGMFRSVDGGATFVQMLAGLNDRTTSCSVETASGDVLVGTWNGVYRSQDDGQSWAFLGLAGERIVDFVRTPNDHVFALTQPFTAMPTHVYRSTDDGDTWTGVLDDSGFAFPASFSALVTDGSVLYAGGRSLVEAVVEVSTDDGDTWVEHSVGAFIPSLTDMAVAATGDVYALTEQNGLYVSADQGVTWTLLPKPWTARASIVAVEAGGTLFVGTFGEGLFRSEDDGATWSTDNTGFGTPLPQIASISFDGPFVYAGSERQGLFRSPIDPAVTVPAANGALVHVFPAYPNPFRAASRVAFELGHAGVVRADVFAADGRRVRRLQDGPMSAGLHDVGWDGRDDEARRAAPGTYWIRIETADAVTTRAVTLLR